MKRLLLLAPLTLLVALGCTKKTTPPPPGPPPTPVSVSVSPGSVTVTVTTTQPFVATVTGATDQSVTWSVSGGGTVNAAGQYTAPASVPAPATATVTATSNADRSKSASATVTIANPANNALWTGRYAFLFNGFEPEEAAGGVAVAGTFVANGSTTSGVITEALVDINRPGSVYQANGLAGSSYIIGADRRGRITLNTDQGTFTFRFIVTDATPDPSPTRGNARFAEFETSQIGGIRGSGIIRKQASGPFSAAMLNGNFAFGFSGTDLSANRVGAVGRFNLDGTSLLTQGNVDIGTEDGSIAGSFPMTGTYGSVDPNNGRGTSIATVTGVGTINFAFYIVSASEAIFLRTDLRTANPLLSGLVLKQTGFPFNNASMNGPIVFNYRGHAVGGASVTIGRVAANGLGNLTAGVLDRNDAGTLTAGASFGTPTTSGTYAISDSPVRGRGTMTFNTTPPQTFVFYMVDGDVPTPNQRRAFLLQTSGTQVGTGLLEAQTSTATPSGTPYFAGNVDPPSCGCAILVGWIAVSGTGFSGTQDRSVFSAGITPDQAWVGTITSSSLSNGRGSATTNSPVTENFVFYMVSPTKFVAINGFDPLNNRAAVTFFEK